MYVLSTEDREESPSTGLTKDFIAEQKRLFEEIQNKCCAQSTTTDLELALRLQQEADREAQLVADTCAAAELQTDQDGILARNMEEKENQERQQQLQADEEIARMLQQAGDDDISSVSAPGASLSDSHISTPTVSSRVDSTIWDSPKRKVLPSPVKPNRTPVLHSTPGSKRLADKWDTMPAKRQSREPDLGYHSGGSVEVSRSWGKGFRVGGSTSRHSVPNPPAAAAAGFVPPTVKQQPSCTVTSSCR